MAFVGLKLDQLIGQFQAANGYQSEDEWQSFTCLCEILANVSINKLIAENGHQVANEFKQSLANNCQSQRDQIRLVFKCESVKSVVEFFVSKHIKECHEISQLNLTAKSALKARELRLLGDKLLKDKHYDDAIQKYTQAIIFAPDVKISSHQNLNGQKLTTDEALELVLAYRSRSSCFKLKENLKAELSDRNESLLQEKLISELTHYSDTKSKIIDDIGSTNCHLANGNLNNNISLTNGHSNGFQDKNLNYSNQELIEKIYNRRSITKRSNQIINGSDSLLLKTSPDRGRHIVTTKHIKPNECLISEKPFASWLKPSLAKQFCDCCLQQLTTESTIYPCKQCTLVAYCSNSCRMKAWIDYHSIECKHLPKLLIMSRGHLAVRILLKAGIEKAINFHEIYGNAHNLEVVDDGYASLYQLVDHGSDHNSDTIFEYILGSLFMCLLMERTELTNKINSDDKQLTENQTISLTLLLLKHILQLQVNGVQIMHQTINEPREEDGQLSFKVNQDKNSIGFGLYPTVSLLNHSCFNVTKCLFNGDQVTFTSCKDMMPGDEITFNYGPHYKADCTNLRQKTLKQLYFFNCQCLACIKNWQ